MFSARGWRTSSYSSNGTDCVEVAPLETGARIRHSKDPAGPVITFTSDQWRRWLDELISGEAGTANGAVFVTALLDGCWQVDAVALEANLHFTASEVTAFVRGVRAGEFDLDAMLTK
jgi:Domain of unknown function (DUF397)